MSGEHGGNRMDALGGTRITREGEGDCGVGKEGGKANNFILLWGEIG